MVLRSRSDELVRARRAWAYELLKLPARGFSIIIIAAFDAVAMPMLGCTARHESGWISALSPQ